MWGYVPRRLRLRYVLGRSRWRLCRLRNKLVSSVREVVDLVDRASAWCDSMLLLLLLFSLSLGLVSLLSHGLKLAVACTRFRSGLLQFTFQSSLAFKKILEVCFHTRRLILDPVRSR